MVELRFGRRRNGGPCPLAGLRCVTQGRQDSAPPHRARRPTAASKRSQTAQWPVEKAPRPDRPQMPWPPSSPAPGRCRRRRPERKLFRRGLNGRQMARRGKDQTETHSHPQPNGSRHAATLLRTPTVPAVSASASVSIRRNRYSEAAQLLSSALRHGSTHCGILCAASFSGNGPDRWTGAGWLGRGCSLRLAMPQPPCPSSATTTVARKTCQTPAVPLVAIPRRDNYNSDGSFLATLLHLLLRRQSWFAPA